MFEPDYFDQIVGALNRHFIGPRHTPYLSHGSAVRHMALVAPPPGANQANTFPAMANSIDLRPPDAN
jgi:hypothetical protein